MKKSYKLIFYFLLAGFLLFVTGGVIYSFWYQFYGAGIKGKAGNISEIPYARNDGFVGLDAQGPFRYVYKDISHNVQYLFTGRTTKEKLMAFFKEQKGWMIWESEALDHPPRYEYFKVDPSEFPMSGPEDEENLGAFKGTEKGGPSAVMSIFFNVKTQQFTVYVTRGHRKEDWQ